MLTRDQTSTLKKYFVSWAKSIKEYQLQLAPNLSEPLALVHVRLENWDLLMLMNRSQSKEKNIKGFIVSRKKPEEDRFTTLVLEKEIACKSVAAERVIASEQYC